MEKRGSWASRSTFILAAVGSAVGLGNAWRFPGLAAKHGGGAFLFVYLIALFVLGIPLLMMEISLGRRVRKGAPGAFRAMNKKTEWVGWAAVTNAFVISTYYAVVFAWVLLMFGISYKFAGMTGDAEAASGLFLKTIETTGTTSGYGIPPILIAVVIVAWLLIYYCIRNGASSVGKVVKYTVFAPVLCLLIMAVKGFMMPGAMEGFFKFVIPDWSALSNASLWIDAVSQVFYSLSIMMAIMVAYGSFLDRDANIASDAIIIALSDMAVSLLSGIVMFTTMYGCGMTVNDMSASGISTAFIIYPTAIVNLTQNGVVNAIFGAIFYLCLVTLAIDSAFSIIEGVSTAIADKFNLSHKKTTIKICCVSAIVSLLYITRAGLAWLDIVDNWTNQYSMIVIGVLECLVVGWIFDPKKVVEEINKNAKKFKMPSFWFVLSVKFISPLILFGFFCWNMYTLFVSNGGRYNADYGLYAELIGGWLIMALCFVSGFIMKGICKKKAKKGFQEDDRTWDEFE